MADRAVEKTHFLDPAYPDRNFPFCGAKEWRTLSNRIEDVTCSRCQYDFRNTTRAAIDKLIAAAKDSPKPYVPLPRVLYDEHNFEHDMAKGPCACGATH